MQLYRVSYSCAIRRVTENIAAFTEKKACGPKGRPAIDGESTLPFAESGSYEVLLFRGGASCRILQDTLRQRFDRELFEDFCPVGLNGT